MTTVDEIEKDAMRLFNSFPREKKYYPVWSKAPEAYRLGFRELAGDADALQLHEFDGLRAPQVYCKCGEPFPCSIRKFILNPPKGPRPSE
ncbi:hypothetical protein SEA_JONJAMES_111 [Gordonia Phage JonJames]|nr:hypothetical protein SEA_JONJAMES_111 [Gordonia Phage JonJames]